MPLHASPPSERSDEEVSIRPEFAQPGELQSVPRFRLADQTLPAQTAYQLVHDELLLDGNSRLNLATFVGTWMEPQARVLIEECLDKNIVDRDESPQTAELELRCVSILAELWNSPQAERATGCSTTGSSEACMLGGLALKWRWRERRRAEGKPTDRPNLVMGANVQVCWEKFCRYWDVEPRQMPLEPGRTCLNADGAIALCDENTIGVVAILGSTFDGAYEPVSEIADALDRLQAQKAWISRSTSTRPPAASSPPSSTPSSSGTSALHACSRSTPRGTSTASCIRTWAGWSGARRTRCRMSSCSGSTTSAAPCPPSR